MSIPDVGKCGVVYFRKCALSQVQKKKFFYAGFSTDNTVFHHILPYIDLGSILERPSEGHSMYTLFFKALCQETSRIWNDGKLVDAWSCTAVGPQSACCFSFFPGETIFF